MYNRPNDAEFVKDGINNYIVNNENTVNLKKQGTKAAIWLKEKIRPGGSKTFKVRLSKAELEEPWEDFDDIFSKRKSETDDYYEQLAPKNLIPEHKIFTAQCIGWIVVDQTILLPRCI